VQPRALPIALLASVVAACGSNEYVEPPTPTVTVARPESRSVVDYLEFTGTTRAINSVDIRARIQGFLKEVNFQEGAYVEAGDLLYVIEPDEYRARVHRAQASLEVARTSKDLAEATLARMEQAYETRAISELDLLEARAKAAAAEALVDQARADLERAQLDLSYTRIEAPISGRVGRTLVDPGNLVGAEEKTLLTNIMQYDPIYAYFDLSERNLLEILGMAVEQRTGTRRTGDYSEESKTPVQLGRANDDGYPFEGLVDFSDQEVDAETGTFLVRGIFPNPQPLRLLPGLFVRLRIPLQEREGALLVDDRAIGSDQSGKFLLVVDAENVVQHRRVETGALVDGLRVIESGIEASDWVVVNGLLRARPGSKVTPQREGEAPPPAEPPVAER
jgi:RND family efflux transporter MFP subunit